MPSFTPHRIAGLLWAALTVAIFSGWFVVTRFSVTRELGIWDIAALRFGIGALILSPVIFGKGRTLPRAAWGEGFVFALLWGLPFVLLVALGIQLTSAGRAAAVAPTLMPVFAGLIGWAMFRQRPTPPRFTGYAAIAAGLAGLLAINPSGDGLRSMAGFAALSAAAGMWAIYTLLFSRSGRTPIQAAALICLWSSALLLPVYLGSGFSRFGLASASEIALQAGYQGVLMSAVAVVTFNRAVSRLGAGAAAAIIALVPAGASLLAVPLLGEMPSLMEAATIALIIAGVVLASRPTPKPPAPAIPRTEGSLQ
ncbi:DMT family transporter [Ancylobacter amanitiformis]|uniref:Drug/metabolite transporter (DMT)-like permease n=1 Tax=Ancylobacter amanitiformis TaxID=217069 RepID=A0ABU0LXC9_9HYPH|nr:DMT family transporter [Ancylobacter amanitiformis]MDQ0513320.1 drug/metabolite transporter (DMT)-like permease [Ancylobacter amanitiformis]